MFLVFLFMELEATIIKIADDTTAGDEMAWTN